jgi:pyridoxal phosphate enzyme (YggS family)
MKSVRESLEELKEQIPGHVKLVAVSKIQPLEKIMEAYHAGHRYFGENKAQELIRKQPDLPHDIEWHFIGHLQRNKVKYLAPFVKMIESVDSKRLLQEINKQALRFGRVLDCLLQFHIATEESKFGFSLDEAVELLNDPETPGLENVRIRGVMGMATFTDDKEKIRTEFRNLKRIYDRLKKQFFMDDESFKEISMGMSGDYKIAIEEGSTIVRIGTAVFGERIYPE